MHSNGGGIARTVTDESLNRGAVTMGDAINLVAFMISRKRGTPWVIFILQAQTQLAYW